MAREQAHIAIDLGAESGRVIVGTIIDDRLTMREVHRFMHQPVPTPAGLCWDLTGLWLQIITGLRNAAAHAEAHHLQPVSVGVDTWGVDWALLSPAGEVLGLPRCYRDPSFGPAHARLMNKLGHEAIYRGTGVQTMSINTLYQYAHRVSLEPGLFTQANTLLFMPDLFHWLLSGVACVERTIASTSQMVDARKGTWNRALLEEAGLPTGPLREPIDPGTVLGELFGAVADTTGLPRDVQVVVPPSHDTASAVAAVPAVAGEWCYLSSGTWSLLGAELREPCITDAAIEANFTNELGACGKVRFLKNIAGLWLVQEVRRQLEREGRTYTYAELTEQAAGAEPLRTLIPVSDPAFVKPESMIDAIRDTAKRSHQPVPETVGQIVRCCLESLALTYADTLTTMERLLGRRFDVLHLVGGGGKNGLLNRMAAHATGRRVMVGPHEATAMGNLLTQAMGLSRIENLEALRRIVAASCELDRVEPGESRPWRDASERYAALTSH